MNFARAGDGEEIAGAAVAVVVGHEDGVFKAHGVEPRGVPRGYDVAAMLVRPALKLLLDDLHHLGRVAAGTEDEEEIDGRETGGVRNGLFALSPQGGSPHSSRCRGRVPLDEEMAELSEDVSNLQSEPAMRMTTYDEQDAEGGANPEEGEEKEGQSAAQGGAEVPDRSREPASAGSDPDFGNLNLNVSN